MNRCWERSKAWDVGGALGAGRGVLGAEKGAQEVVEAVAEGHCDGKG